MSPLPNIANMIFRRSFDSNTASSQFSTQWQNPKDVFNVLLILGGDIIKAALAQLAGSRITPIAFSFGWVAYGISAVIAAVGDNKLMPVADCNCKVINGKTGYVRDNTSWILGRLVRDLESWMDAHDGLGGPSIRRHLDGMKAERFKMDKERANEKRKKGQVVPEPEYPTQTGLCIAIYKAGEVRPGHPGYDMLYYLGFVTIFIQFGIAAVPCGLYGDWGELLVLSAGTILCLASGSLDQWAKEKWTARKNTTSTFVLTRGNGSQFAIVVIGDGKGLDLEDLAAVPANVDVWTSRSTKTCTLVLALLWLCLLVSASGLSNHTWYLLAIGAIGIVENIYVAGRWRRPEDFGLPLHFVEVVGEPKVMNSLFAVEEKYPHVGRAMLHTFFPGKLFATEQERWDLLEETAEDRERIMKEKTST